MGNANDDCPCGRGKMLWNERMQIWVFCRDCQSDIAERNRETQELYRGSLIRKVLLESCRVPERYINASMGDFDMEFGDLDLNQGLLITGPVGSGKTHLLVALVRRLVQKGTSPLFVTATDYQNSADPGGDPELAELAMNAPILCFDDLGIVRGTEWTYEKLYALVNYRYNKKLVTFWSTNQKVGELDPRISRRIVEMCTTVEMSKC